MNKQTITILDNEYWYGGIVNDGYLFPLDKNSEYGIDFSKNISCNQIAPLFISSKGRYLWVEDGGRVDFNEGIITVVSSDFELDASSKTLKEAYLKLTAKKFAPNGRIPDESLFLKPQLNTWIDLQKNQTQEGILEYAQSYKDSGYDSGLFIIDDGWQTDYGDWTFDKNKFSAPKDMINKLHAMGFKVAVWLVPYVSMDLPVVEELLQNDALLKDENGALIKAVWFDGVSYVLDFGKPYAKVWFNRVASFLKKEYGIDGFKFDCGDECYLEKPYKKANELTRLWVDILEDKADGYILETRACYKYGGEHCVQRLADKAHIWGVELVNDDSYQLGGFLRYGLSTVVPDILSQGISGYLYGCADMVGGGNVYDYGKGSKFDDELFVRFCQATVFMPMIQFSYRYWKSENPKVREVMKRCLQIRNVYVDYIVTLAKNASKSGEPILRYMEYEFPNCGMEKVTDQFMLGDKYLIAPIVKKQQTEKTVVFPPHTKWKDCFSDKVYTDRDTLIQVNEDSVLAFERIDERGKI